MSVASRVSGDWTWDPVFHSLLPELPPKVSLDPKADLCLQVGTSPTISFAVCARDLERSSPVWDRMLNGYFMESKKHRPHGDASEWIIELPDDNPRAMGVLLDIVHGRFDRVPTYDFRRLTGALMIDDLYSITVLLDKYDMMHVVRPWAGGWLRDMQDESERSNSGEANWSHVLPKSLWITWTFGDLEGFEAAAKAMLLEYSHSTKDEYNLQVDVVPEPLNIYDVIEEARPRMIERLLALMDNLIEDLIDGSKRLCKKPKRHPSWGLCVATMLGKAIQSLSRLGIWPLPQASDVQMSVSALAERLKSVDLTGYGGERHRCCQDDLLGRQIDGVLNDVPFFLDTAGARDHLMAQARKSGVSHRPE